MPIPSDFQLEDREGKINRNNSLSAITVPRLKYIQIYEEK
jgi:hypothetical protein